MILVFKRNKNLNPFLFLIGVNLTKIKAPGLVYFIIWSFATMILQISYSGTLIGFLTFPSREPSITNLKELADAIRQRGFKIAFKKYSLVQSLLVRF